jgi:hypothetical protein
LVDVNVSEKVAVFTSVHFHVYLYENVNDKKVKVKESRCRPGVAQRVPGFHDNGTEWWKGCQPYAPAAFTPRKYTW